MKKLKTMIHYECATSFKYIWIFYAIQYTIAALISAITVLSTGSFEEVGINSLEMNTLIYVGILGILGFNEDFKMLIQNGFTRSYILLATISMFLFISGIMSLVDTITGNVLHYLLDDYSSLYGNMYGYNHVFANWIWLFLMNLLVCCFLYLGILVINKIGKTVSIYLGILLGGFGLLIAALFQFVLPHELVNNLAETALKITGFMSDGTINMFYPILALLLFVIILSIGSYHVIRRTELTR